ncbi:hypothetical protein QQ020_15735 [Fulvivirgaceae bacterium BMA12]|uniref:Uncharacterized protein n=1 Tax=Agaribacillus aureus TaxID=3051825 RepID=A0ABT8L6Z2_9BACT|nr:hypothetical protein [Fulvivirgaceae bacterium BMA12]
MADMLKLNLWVICFFLLVNLSSRAANRIPLKVKNFSPGAPITLGIPFPSGMLHSPDHVRILDKDGREIPSQITEVTSWEPLNNSVKWIWAFFFAGSSDSYTLEYGNDISRSRIKGDKVVIINSQRQNGFAEINTGPLRLTIKKGEGGFLNQVMLDLDRDGFGDEDIIAEEPNARGSFLDLLDDAGIDPSRAIVKHTVKEKGSGPLHGILRIEGEYQYGREDNNVSPFVIRIHAYAGQSYFKVLHTLTYTGVPDKHTRVEGEHSVIATQSEKIIPEDREDDPGWVQPNDQIAGTGLCLNYRLSGDLEYQTGYYDGTWWDQSPSKIFKSSLRPNDQVAVTQTGPKPTRMPPVPKSSPDERIKKGFVANISCNTRTEKKLEKVAGWIDVADKKWGISVGIRDFIQEYPKALKIFGDSSRLYAYIWSPDADPMNFARWSNKPEGQMLGNFAQGMTKTTELVYHFHSAGQDAESIARTVNYFLDPPIAHAHPAVYAESKVYGSFAPRSDNFSEYERGMDYKMDWMLFNQNWEPWYGMFDYGDFKTHYFNKEWKMWANNEPAQDFMLWMQFVRTGDRKYYLAAEAMSRHAMDVDNIHWPKAPRYYGDTNPSLDFWTSKDQPAATPYLGIGRRHASQHWISLLSAHVWVQGWLASYYLSGNHRGLEAARQTADTYSKRIWGDHGLTGRRLYLSVWNMVEVWDATKDECYFEDLKDRVRRMLNYQGGTDQCTSLVMDRYGYSQVYASQGLRKYLQLTGDPKVRNALIRHARSVRDVPPWNHKYESYLSTIHSLLVGYELSGEKSFFEEAVDRAKFLKTDKLPKPIEAIKSQGEMSDALESVSHLPDEKNYHEGANKDVAIWDISQGLRVFGWTHAYNVPYLLYWLRKEKNEKSNIVLKKR